MSHDTAVWEGHAGNVMDLLDTIDQCRDAAQSGDLGRLSSLLLVATTLLEGEPGEHCVVCGAIITIEDIDAYQDRCVEHGSVLEIRQSA
jgi:hypothetical protein